MNEQTETKSNSRAPPVDICHITAEEQEEVCKMLHDECEVFTKDEWGIFLIPDSS